VGIEFGEQIQNIETYVVRPGGVLLGDWSAFLLGFILPAVTLERLAAVMVDLAMNGGNEQVVINKDIIQRGGELLLK
jgi:hypothetical protein